MVKAQLLGLPNLWKNKIEKNEQKINELNSKMHKWELIGNVTGGTKIEFNDIKNTYKEILMCVHFVVPVTNHILNYSQVLPTELISNTDEFSVIGGTVNTSIVASISITGVYLYNVQVDNAYYRDNATFKVYGR